MNAVKAEGAMLRGSVSFWVEATLAKQRNAIRKQEHGCMSPCHVSAGIPGRLALGLRGLCRLWCMFLWESPSVASAAYSYEVQRAFLSRSANLL